jgi:TDG/mug DNA glycosylase family protein
MKPQGPDIVEDLLTPALSLVVCGTAPGPRSAARRAYYAGPGNRLWSMLAETKLTPRVLDPLEYRDRVIDGPAATHLRYLRA